MSSTDDKPPPAPRVRRSTDEELRVLGRWQKLVPAAKLTALVIGIIVPSIAGSMSAISAAKATAEAQSHAVKQKSEAGFQVTKAAVEELQARVLVLEQAARRAQAAEARAKRPKQARAQPPLPPAPTVAVTERPKALPRDLDKAERQVYQGAPTSQPPAARASDAAP